MPGGVAERICEDEMRSCGDGGDGWDGCGGDAGMRRCRAGDGYGDVKMHVRRCGVD